MKRRTVLQLVGAMLAMPTRAVAQTSKTNRLGYMSTTDETITKPFLESFPAGMRERGYVRGRNLLVDERYTRGDASRLPALTDELIALKPDAMAGIESACRVMAARTKTIPIVILARPDRVIE